VQGVAPGSVATVTQRYIWGLDLAGDWERGMGQTRPQGSRTRTGGVGALLGVMTSAGKTYSVCNDANGNVMGFIDLDTASLTARFDYDAFGNPITNWTAPGHPASETITRVRFSSKHQDPHTGWVYYGYRWYDPENGRWPSKDPIEERGGINLYGMVGNDAVNRIDLLGLADILVEMTRTYHQWDTTSNFTAKATSKAIAACCKEVKGQTIELKKGKYSLVPDPRFRGGDIDYPIPTGNHTGNWSPSSTTSIQAIVSSINAGIIANYDNAMTAYQQAVSEGGGATPNLLQRIFGKIGQGGGPSPPGEITLYGIPVGEFGTHNILINPGRGFSGTRMHIGENCNWSRGCPIVGKNAQLRSTAITIYQGQVG
jgi:RHS repeat-associated protein